MTFLFLILFILGATLFKTKFLIFSLALFAAFLFYDKRYSRRSLILSFLISLIWSVFSVNLYDYSFSFKFFGIFDVYPFLAFGISLYGSYYIFQNFLNYLKIKNLHFRLEFFLYTFFYVSILLFGEWFFYHYVGVKNLATSLYPPLAICNCLHAPLAMSGIYIFLGPLFFILNTSLSLYIDNKLDN